MEKSITSLKTKQKGKIVQINADEKLKRRLLDMGIIKGSSVEIVRIAPLGDPIDIKVKGYQLSLRKNEAEGILVEVL